MQLLALHPCKRGLLQGEALGIEVEAILATPSPLIKFVGAGLYTHKHQHPECVAWLSARSLPRRAEERAAIAEAGLLLNAQQLVVLGEALAAAGRAGLQMPRAQAHGEVRDEGVLGLTGAVRDKDAPLVVHAELPGSDGLRNTADLVHLEEHGVCGALVEAHLHALDVRAVEVIPDDLHLVANGGRELRVALKVLLGEGVLQEDDGVGGNVLLVLLHHCLARKLVLRLGAGVLEVKVVDALLALPELGGCGVGADDYLAGVAGLLDGLHEQLQALLRVLHGRGEAALIPHGGRVQTVLLLDDALQRMVGLRPKLHGIREAGRAHRDQEELLEGQVVAGVHAAVDHVEARHGHGHLGRPRDLVDVLVQWQALLGGAGPATGHGDAEDGVGTKLGLVVRAIQRQHRIINGGLLRRVLTREGRGDDALHVLHRLRHALAEESLAAVAELASLVLPRAGTTRHGCPEGALIGGHLHLDRRVAAAVEDLPCVDLLDRHG
mmetsp:Transcript_73492/g.195366  ORF Transcript_73492/g.195366 Transcript_73492/m.195366 type:complete len:494 (-) Transcript_73492:77-1558(-)